MIWFVIGHIFSTIISLMRLSHLSENDKDLEILVLRYQLDVMVRKQNQPVRPNRAEKTILAVLTVQLKQTTKRTIGQLGEVIRIVRPETVVRWHRELVRRKWTYQSKNRGGRPRIKQEIENLIVRLALENLRWGYARIEGSYSNWVLIFPSPQCAIYLTAMVFCLLPFVLALLVGET